MSNFGAPNQYLHASGKLTGAIPAWQSSLAFFSPPVRNGPGDWTLKLEHGLVDQHCRCTFTERAAVPSGVQFSHVRPSIDEIRVLAVVAGVPTDVDFEIVVIGIVGA